MELSKNQTDALKYIIKFYTYPQDDFLKRKFGKEDFLISSKYFKENIEYFINKKIGIDRVYQSLFNAASSFAMFRYMIGNDKQKFISENEEKKALIAINEPYVNSLILNLCIFKELMTFNKKIIIKDEVLSKHFRYLDALNTRVRNSGVESVRNGWTAHPFENEDEGLIYKPVKISKEKFKVLEKICHEKDRDKFNDSGDRLAWFCQKYLISVYEISNVRDAVMSVIYKRPVPQVRIETKPNEMLIEMSKFSSILKETKLLGIEPFFHPSDQDIEAYIKNPEF